MRFIFTKELANLAHMLKNHVTSVSCPQSVMSGRTNEQLGVVRYKTNTINKVWCEDTQQKRTVKRKAQIDSSRQLLKDGRRTMPAYIYS